MIGHRFNRGERKIWQNIKKFQNIMKMIIASVLQSLTEKFHNGREYNTIPGFRSSIPAFHNSRDGYKVGNRLTGMLIRF